MATLNSKQGKEFEDLVTWITRCLHERAVITPNDKIPDVDTGRLRQLDISIRLKDGPTEFLAIVEVRDRSRPVGEDYIEQVSQKCRSVCAHAGFIVSSSGFCETAVKKAEALNIRLFTLEEATSLNWTQCLQIREINQFRDRWDNVLFLFLEPETNRIISPHDSLVQAIKADPNAKVLVNAQNEAKFSLGEITAMVINQNRDYFFQETTILNGRHRKRVFVDLRNTPNETILYFQGRAGTRCKVEKLGIEVDCWKELRKLPVVLSKYLNPATGKAIAEVASATIDVWGDPHKLEMLATLPDEAHENGTKILMRMQKLDDTRSDKNPRS
ncbi:MAG: restriction endonuclease [Verrucomicrobiota bacterium]